MHTEYTAEQTLINAGMRITAVRLLIWRSIREHFENPFTLADLEAVLPTVDRSTLFRNLTTLAQSGVLHAVDDGSGAQKYCVCHCDDNSHHHGHVHITCTRCHRTFCLTSVMIPPVPLPKGFDVSESEYVVKGVCTECQKSTPRGTD